MIVIDFFANYGTSTRNVMKGVPSEINNQYSILKMIGWKFLIALVFTICRLPFTNIRYQSVFICTLEGVR